eukprot:Pgem_evm1s8486
MKEGIHAERYAFKNLDTLTKSFHEKLKVWYGKEESTDKEISAMISNCKTRPGLVIHKDYHFIRSTPDISLPLFSTVFEIKFTRVSDLQVHFKKNGCQFLIQSARHLL